MKTPYGLLIRVGVVLIIALSFVSYHLISISLKNSKLMDAKKMEIKLKTEISVLRDSLTRCKSVDNSVHNYNYNAGKKIIIK